MENDIVSLKQRVSRKLPMKFKAYSYVYKKFFEVVNLFDIESNRLEGNVTFKDNEGDVWDANFDDKDYTLLQSIGLTDCNGVLLYEGDIVVDNFGRLMMVGYGCCRHQFIALTETNFRQADFFSWLERHKNPDNETVLHVNFVINIYEVTDLKEIIKNNKCNDE